MWEPWIGPGYRTTTTRLLLLGESCYNWLEDGALKTPQHDHPSLIVEAAQTLYVRNSRTMVKLTQALCKRAKPSVEQATDAWAKVAFTNYVPSTVGDGAAQRPNAFAWSQAKREWPILLDALKPNLVIVLGFTMWRCMPPAQIFIKDNVQGYRLNNGDIAMCHATNHPARGPSWTGYSRFIAQACDGAG